MKKINLFTIIAVLLSIVWLVLESFHALHTQLLGTDFVSWALQSMAAVWHLGSSYTDYWNINPPGLMLMTTIWGWLFGGSLHSFQLLFLLSLTGILIFAWKILRQVFKPLEQLLIFFFFGVCFFSSTVQSQFFPSEINGLLFTLIGIWFALKTELKSKNIFWGSFFLILAGQMKEVYAPAILVLMPHFFINLHHGKAAVLEFLKASLKGALIAGTVLVGYLLLTQSLAAYGEISAVKSQQFPLSPSEIGYRLYPSIQFPKDRFIFIQYPMYVLLGGSLLFVWYWLSTAVKSVVASKKQQLVSLTLKLSVSAQSFRYLVIAFYWLGAVLGASLQGRYGFKYEIPILLALLMLIAVVAKLLTEYVISLFNFTWLKNQLLVQLIILGSLAVLIFPKQEFFVEQLQAVQNYSLAEHQQLWQSAERDQILGAALKIKADTLPSDCMMSVYGWGVGANYYYAQRQPCSRFFMANILPASKQEEYRQELLANPPAVIVYTDQATDMQVLEFEQTVFDYQAVLASCYIQDDTHANVYWADSKQNLAECLKIGFPQSSL